ncbi:hypothetical protein BJ973_001196 [Actinoplanes tereljensis]|uniref:hypothetical protein n=1 Tax=Paractinoplanes tereljensis TaxID=571912 RepID=UPI001940CEBF|nr:hypothetical protein [Actinoplanes tereljensis]
MAGERKPHVAPWRPVAGLAVGLGMVVGWWFFEPDDVGWKFVVSILLLMAGTGLVVDSLRHLRRPREHVEH